MAWYIENSPHTRCFYDYHVTTFLGFLQVTRATKMLYTPLTIIGHGYRTLNCFVFVDILNMRIETYFTLSSNTTISTVRDISRAFRVISCPREYSCMFIP